MKNILKWAAISGWVCLIGSCSEHREVADYTLRVGNIYLEDGRIIPPSVYVPGEVPAAGVVVHVGNLSSLNRVVVVGLDEWSDAASNLNEELPGVHVGVEDMDGKSNTASMLEAVREAQYQADESADGPVLECPAAESVQRYRRGDGSWHLPACGELLALSRHLPIVTASLQMVQGEPLQGGWYLSSTQDGTNESTRRLFMLNVSLTEGRVISSEKTSVKKVRPFLVIQ